MIHFSMNKNILSRFPDNLKKALVDSNKTQQDLAVQLHTTQQTVSRWINGVNEPDFQTLLEICVYLDETPNSLLGFDKIPVSIFSELKKE